jgi:hypothetical protein
MGIVFFWTHRPAACAANPGFAIRNLMEVVIRVEDALEFSHAQDPHPTSGTTRVCDAAFLLASSQLRGEKREVRLPPAKGFPAKRALDRSYEVGLASRARSCCLFAAGSHASRCVCIINVALRKCAS